ncbi:MAG: nitroreductase family protein [Syntrophobacteraceae bacterium]
MAEFLDVVKGRRSIRNFEAKDVPEEVLEQILEAVRWSPSWANCQCWEVVVVRSPELKEKLQATLNKGNPATKSMVQAPVVLAVCGKLRSSGYYKDEPTTKLGDWFMFDLGVAAQTLCLAAHNLGIGTVIVASLDHYKAKEILGVPREYELAVLIPLGYPSRESSAPPRREAIEFTHREKF